jgi:hypothetical protein
MNILGKGSKPVVYKNNIRLQFYGTTVDDCQIAVDHIYTKVMPDGVAVVYGHCTAFLLYSYLDNSGMAVHTADSKSVKFCESIICNIPESTNIELLYPQATFEPHISYNRAVSNAYTWDIEIEGEFDVVIYGDKDVVQSTPFKKSSNFTENATVMRLNKLGLPADQLLDMDTDSINRLMGGGIEKTFPQQIITTSEQSLSYDNKISDQTPTENS